MRKKTCLLIMLIILSLQTGCMYFVRYDDAYHGKVVDKETREPIEGAVVLGTWGKYHYGLGGGYSEFYDAKEALTDKNGEFTIPGQGVLVLSNVGHMGVLIYKFGYTYYQTGWTSIKEGIYSSQEVKWEGDMPIFPLRKVTDEDRKKDRSRILIPSVPSTPGKEIRLMLREVDKEYISRGWEPILIEPELRGK